MRPENDVPNEHREAALMVPVIQTAGLHLLGCEKAASPTANIEDDYALSNDMALIDPQVVEAIDTLRQARRDAVTAVMGLSQALESYFTARNTARDDALARIQAMNVELGSIETTE
jgi:hypothetical protein